MNMNYAELFDQFWERRRHTLQINNPQRTFENIRARLEGCGSIAEIDEYVCSLTNGKETNRRIIVEFYRFLEQRQHMQVDSILYDMTFYDSSLERQLAIAKFLHEPKTPEEIERHFGISDETRKKDMRALEDGIEFLGSSISITKVRKDGKDGYRSTMHPVFLPLNLTEVYAMTVYLEDVLDPKDINTEVIRNVIGRIKSQLSDYALECLSLDRGGDYPENRYLDDESLAKQREGIRMYLMKSNQPCRFLWEEKEYTGRIRKENGREFFVLEDGTPLDVDPRDVEFVIESLEYR